MASILLNSKTKFSRSVLVLALSGCAPFTAYDVPAPKISAPSLWATSVSPNASVAKLTVSSNGAVLQSIAIAGSATTLSSPYGLAVDSTGDVFVADAGANAIDEFQAGASGNVAPVVRISGSSTLLNMPTSVAVGNDGTVYVGNARGPNLLLSFSPKSNGNIPPTDTGGTSLLSVRAILIDPQGNLAVADPVGSAVSTFTTNLVGPIRTISGANSTLSSPESLTFDAGFNMLVGDAGGSNTTAHIATFASEANGNVAPIRNLSGAQTTLGSPSGVSIDPNTDALFAADYSAAITMFAPLANGNVAPTNRDTSFLPQSVVFQL